MRSLLVLCFVASFLLQPVFAGVDEAAFDVLERNCVECHNSHDKKGGVVLDKSPLKIDDLGFILEVVSGEDPEMPPKRDPLTKDEITALRKWVQAGAKIPAGKVLKDRRLADRKWWSLNPVSKPKVPEAGKNWARNEIDRFVYAKLQEKGLAPSQEADARTLLRRLTFDLTGLPPTPEEVREYIEASKQDPETAYEKLVGRLLDSPRYGEQWARHWLDVARYGESHGYDKDKARFNAWPYRDYVIRSFNEDKPWTRFVQEQVAGDVLFPDDPQGIVALGFVAAGPWDFIAHTEVGEGKLDGRIAKHMDRDDMVSAVFNAFMSTTVQCAQCHNHKFDPVSMEDYYRLQAVFAGVDRADRVYNLDPDVVKRRVGLETEIAKAGQEIRNLERKTESEGGEELKKAREILAKLEKAGVGNFKIVPEHGYHSQIVKSPDVEKWVQVELPGTSDIEKIRLIGCHDNFGGIGAGFGFPVRFRVEVSDDPKFEKGVEVAADFTKQDYPNPGVDPVTIGGGEGKYVRVTATKLVKHNNHMFALAELEVLDADGKNLAAGAKVTSKDSIKTPNRWRRTNLVDGKFTTGGDPDAKARLAEARENLSAILKKLENPDRVAKIDGLKQKKSGLEKKLKALPAGNMVYALAADFKPRSQFKPTKGKMRAVHFLHRGDMTNPGNLMKPGAPSLWDAVAPEFALESDNEGERRAALARYLTHPDNPLLWRSAVNRIWLGHMGRGIVDSPNDFGRMGMTPTHPGLLDWLATRLRDTNSVKDLHRLIVTSSTYRQSSANDPDKAAIDASNAFYWKANRRKLRAEEMRDAILSVSGALDLTMGGPSFKDFKFKDDHTPKYWYHLHDPNDPKTHRRTIYRFIARSQTQPFLTTLDCADPSQMVAKRDETTTALQALSLMNNPFMAAMAGKLAGRTKDVEEAFWLVLGRAPTTHEKDLLSSYLEKHGMPATARLLFNLNEFAYVD